MSTGIAIFCAALSPATGIDNVYEGLFVSETGKSHNNEEQLNERVRLGFQAQNAGDLKQAERIYREVLELDDRHTDALHYLGLVKSQCGEHLEAAELLKKAVSTQPSSPLLHYSLALVLRNGGQQHEAIECLHECLRFAPRFDKAYAMLGLLWQDLTQWEKAESAYRQALALQANDDEVELNLGLMLRNQKKMNEAVSHYRRLLTRNPRHAKALHNLGDAYKELGEMEAANRILQKCISADPQSGKTYYLISRLKTKNKDYAKWIPQIEGLLTSTQTDTENRVHLCFALANFYEAIGEDAKAFSNWQEGNRLQRAAINFDVRDYLDYFNRLKAAFSPDLFEAKAGYGNPSPVPIFIIGMPRSGTTLVEQILASHPEVYGAGELPFLGQLAEKLPGVLGASKPYPECIKDLTPECATQLGEEYVQRVQKFGPEAKHIADKLPHNFIQAALIPLLMPNAKIVHCRRNPMDTCLSCFVTLFGDALNYTHNLKELGTIYRYYQDLMAHWRSISQIRIFEIEYEYLVSEQESSTRELLEFCGLEWSPECLDFHLSRRPVRSASSVQVRQPMYRTSVERWKRYEEFLEPLKNALAGE